MIVGLWRYLLLRFGCAVFGHDWSDYRYAAMVGAMRPVCRRCGEVEPPRR